MQHWAEMASSGGRDVSRILSNICDRTFWVQNIQPLTHCSPYKTEPVNAVDNLLLHASDPRISFLLLYTISSLSVCRHQL